MKKVLSTFLLLLISVSFVLSQTTVKVTFKANTSTVPDTLTSRSFVQIRGSADVFGPWGKTGALMTNVGGDYWQTQVSLKPGDTIQYKFFTNTIAVDGENEHKGWENNTTDPSGNRILIVPTSDVVLPLQFVNGTPTNQAQFFTPLAHGADSVAVMFRVNMQGNENFNKETQFVAVRGGFPASNGWSKNFVLTKENPHGNGGSRNYDASNFWSGVTVMPKSEVGKTVEYKFVILNAKSADADVATWESTSNRSFIVGGDTTVYWKYWENKAPVPFKGKDTVIVKYTADLTKAISLKGFTPGDTIQVRSGWANTAKNRLEVSPSVKTLTKSGITGNVYTATDTLIAEKGATMYYQYYLVKGGLDIRENFFNFDYKGTESSLGERRSIVIAANNDVKDIVSSVTDGRRQPEFRNMTKLKQQVTVKVTCDLRPAYYTVLGGDTLESIQGNLVTLKKAIVDSIYKWGVWINGPMTNGWTEWGGSLRDSLSKKMYDDGTHGDATAGDRIYTREIILGPQFTDGRDKVGQEFKFGIYGGDNESGFGLNHIDNIDDSQTAFTLATQFGSINPNRYRYWDYNTKTPVVPNVNVTFRANTSTVPDTLTSNSFVQIRGSADVFGPWGKTGKLMTNVGGDYWQAQVSLKPGDTIQYKFFTNTIAVDGENEHKGWENNTTDPSGNRILIVPTSDVVLPLQFVNGTPTNQAQFFTPLAHGADSVAVMFRVNMQGNENFNKETQFVAVRGGFPASNGWSKNFVLTKENPHGNGGSRNYDASNFWSGVTVMPKSEVGKTVEYKFVILNAKSADADVATWESTSNRSFIVSGDTTIYWKYWENKAPVAFKGKDTVIVKYTADLTKAISLKGFTPGDTIQVRSGWSNTAKNRQDISPSVKTLTKSGITGNIYTATDTLIAEIGATMYYQYYLVKGGLDIREIFFNFDYKGTETSLGERRSIVVAANNDIKDIVSSVTDSRRQPEFRNMTKLKQQVTVKVTCDLRSAYFTLMGGDTLESIQGNVVTLKKAIADSVYKWGVWINGPMTNGWTEWGGSLRDSLSKKMYDDGTHGDATAGDRIFTATLVLGPQFTDGRERVGQEFKFGIYGGDNESGFGLNHIENIDDAAATFTLNNQFGSINPKRYKFWNFDTKTPVKVEKLDGIPLTYELEQNYPNPFNPETVIRYQLPNSGKVTLKVYDLMGREVATLVNKEQEAGRYEVRFGSNSISSGVYFYHIDAGSFKAVKKMMLMK